MWGDPLREPCHYVGTVVPNMESGFPWISAEQILHPTLVVDQVSGIESQDCGRNHLVRDVALGQLGIGRRWKGRVSKTYRNKSGHLSVS